MNKNLISNFEKLVNYTKLSSDPKDKHRLKPFEAALAYIKNFPTEIKSGSELRQYKGLGEGVERRVNEILKTGILSELPKPKPEDIALEELMSAKPGIGPETAKKYISMGIYGLNQLIDLYNSGGIQLTHSIIGALLYYVDIHTPMERKEVKKIEDFLNNELKKIDKTVKITVAGSYRRGKEILKDMDVLITTETYQENFLDKILNHLSQVKIKHEEKLPDGKVIVKEEPFITYDFTREGKTVYRGLVKIDKVNRRLDLRYVAKEKYPTAILYFTGSKNLNTLMRNQAIKLGLKLSEYELEVVATGEKLPITSEEDVFKILGILYLEPEQRSLT